MNDLHSEYLKDDHFEQDEEDEVNLEPQKNFNNESESPDQQLQNSIMEQVLKLEKREDSISAELEDKLGDLLDKIRVAGQSEEEIVKLRMSELALNKILVYTHGKSEVRLVLAHHHIGRAYLNYKCYEQAIDHLTLALKKNSKLGQVKLTKLYHSHILTTLSKCYYEIASYEDALQVLSRAEDMQTAAFSEMNEGEKVNVETIKLMAGCHCKLKNYKKAHEYIQRALDFSRSEEGEKSKEVAKLKIESGKIFYEEKNYSFAINQLDRAVELLIEMNYGNRMQLVELEDLLALYYEKNGQFDKQVETLLAKLQLFSQIYDQSHKNTLKLKRSIATILIKNQRNKEAIVLLEQILQTEEKVYGAGSVHVGKTLKMLGLVYMSSENELNSAEHYLKRALKILQQQGNVRLMKEIKGKLNTIKESREKRINGLIQQQQ